MQKTPILALIPAWSEEIHIAPVVETTRNHLDALVVDDGADDETPVLATAAGATVVSQDKNLGKGRALVTGFNWAMERGYDAVLSLDADGQHDPNEIHKFLKAYCEDAGDLITGRRNFKQMPFHNR